MKKKKTPHATPNKFTHDRRIEVNWNNPCHIINCSCFFLRSGLKLITMADSLAVGVSLIASGTNLYIYTHHLRVIH